MTQRIEDVIFENILADDKYARKVLPFLEPEYYDTRVDKALITYIKKFQAEHNQCPTKKILEIFLNDSKDFKQDEYDAALAQVRAFDAKEKNIEWLLERTEKFCRDKAVYNAMMESIAIAEGRNTKFNPDAIPSILQKALGVSFDKSVGHDYFEDADKRYDFYHLEEERIPFDLEMFNRVTKGGLPKKTLNVILAGTNVGKSLILCHHAAACIKKGYNVLYITLEMAEERIAERIDCNLFDVELDELIKMKKEQFSSKITDISAKAHGKLIIHEYPTCGAHVGHFKALLDELKTKKNFIPHIVIVDYINICASQRYKAGANINSYTLVKSIAEELRGMAVEFNIPVLSATQTNRGGWDNSDVDMADTSESAGLPMTVDWLIAAIRTEELDALGQILMKQLKSRYNNVNYYKRFVVGVDINKFKLFNVDQAAQDALVKDTDDDKPAFDRTRTGQRQVAERAYRELDFN